MWATVETENLEQEGREQAGAMKQRGLGDLLGVTRRKLSRAAGRAQQTRARLFHWGEPHTWSSYIAFQEILMLPSQSGNQSKTVMALNEQGRIFFIII